MEVSGGQPHEIKCNDYFRNVSADFQRQADVLLMIEEKHDHVHELPCHSAFLRLHSKVFDEMVAALTTEFIDEGAKKHTGWSPAHGFLTYVKETIFKENAEPGSYSICTV